MNMTHIFLFLLLFVLASCSHVSVEGDRELRGKEIPEFLSQYKEAKYEAEFYEKFYGNKHSYEVKYEKDKKEISLTFDDEGTLIEREENISLDDLSNEVKTKIVTYLNKEYPGNKILEVEKRQLKDKSNLIDVEIRHDSSKSGYWEVSFTPNGQYVSREMEDYQTVQTLY